ncbi:MAG: redoxin domain-containing protein [bacterium]|nr:redoxin domain-containing protein [bacterium]
MKSMIRFALVFAAIVPACIGADSGREAAGIDAPPRHGENIAFRLNPALIPDGLAEGETPMLQVFPRLPDPPFEIPMTRTTGLWRAWYGLKDTSIKAIFFAFVTVDSSGTRTRPDLGQDLFDAPVVDAAGRPVYGAYEAIGISHTGISDLRPENLSLAIEAFRRELRFHPDNYSGRLLLASARLKNSDFSEAARRSVEAEIDSVLASGKDRESAVRFAASAYRMMGRTEKAEALEKSLADRDPKGDLAARKRFTQILGIEDRDERIRSLERFVADFPGSPFVEPALSQIVSAVIETGDSRAMAAAGDRLLRGASTLTGAHGLAGLAGVFADLGIEPDRALSYAGRAMEILAAEKAAGGGSAEAAEEREEAESRFRAVLGWVHVQRGEIVPAVSELQEAVKGPLQGKAFYHLGIALEKAGRLEDALVQYGRAAAFSGDVGDAAYAAFRSLWKNTGRDTLLADASLDEQARWVETASRERILARRSVRPAPDFLLEDARGGRVRLSDQQGNVVLLCFWASWSQSSMKLMEELDALAGQYGRSILFLTVAMDRNKTDVRSAVRKNDIVLPVLLNSGMEQAYRLSGVPAVFLIDRDGRIHFTHMGFRRDINSILSVEIDDLLGATAL